jgi:hypothetical protein
VYPAHQSSRDHLTAASQRKDSSAGAEGDARSTRNGELNVPSGARKRAEVFGDGLERSNVKPTFDVRNEAHKAGRPFFPGFAAEFPPVV